MTRSGLLPEAVTLLSYVVGVSVSAAAVIILAAAESTAAAAAKDQQDDNNPATGIISEIEHIVDSILPLRAGFIE